MKCPSCARDNPEGAKFCSECASALRQELACPSCGFANAPGSRVCNECAQALATDAPLSRTPTPSPSPALPASFADGRYAVKGFLGEGGRKRVYLAHDTKLDRDVAVAVIKTEGLDAGGLVRVRREAQAMGRLGDHPHVVVVHDVGEDEGQPYIVSRYMPGGSVEEQLANAEGHRLPVDQAVRTAEQVSLALDHAHKNGIIHRDLKPGNVWLTAEGTAMLGDFGLAMALDRSRMTAHEPVPDAAAGQQAGIWGRFVGRRDEIEQLKAALEAMLSGHGSLVMVVGEPGIGKSRLAREFTVYASLRGAQVLTGHCYEGEITVPYLPFVDALRQYVRGRAGPAL